MNPRSQSSDLRIVLFSPGLEESGHVWGEKLVVAREARLLKRVFPNATVMRIGAERIDELAPTRVDLLISYYTGPYPPWRVDDIADRVSGATVLRVVNHADLLEEFTRVPVDAYMTNSRRAADLLAQSRPTLYWPLAVENDFDTGAPIDAFRSDVVYLGGGGRGNKPAETTRHYLEAALDFDFALWGSHWDRDYWSDVYADNPSANRWHQFCRGVLPIDDIGRLYSSAKIVLNYHERSQREWGMWNNRVFEALACGALLITDDAEGLAEEFRDGLVLTQGGSDTRRLIEHYLAHPEQRERIGATGRAIVRQGYTYENWLAPVRDFCARLMADSQQTTRAAAPRVDGRAERHPDFSIIIPVYNRMLGLREAVDSALAQTCRNFELIIADDGSESSEVCEFLDACSGAARVRVLRLPHRGPGAAINAAARVARGEYLCRLDSDDMLSTDALETLRHYVAREPDVSYFYSSRMVIDEAGKVIETHHRSRPFDLRLLAERFTCNHLICVRRRDFLAVNGFREEIRFGEDYDLALRMAARFRFRNVDEFLYKLRYHRAGNITNDLSAAERDFWLREIASSSGAALRSILDGAGEKRA